MPEKDQHFMTDKKLIKEIVSSAGIKKNERILEIGAGTGNLTGELAKTGGRVVAVEIDRKFKEQLMGLKAEIVFGNALKLIDKIKFKKIISNLPYAICEPLFQRLPYLDFELAVFTVPEKFARRVMKTNSRLGFVLNEFFETKKLFSVPRKAFKPEPKTDSIAILLKRRKKSLVSLVILQRKMKIKNAIMRALFLQEKYTKNQARKAIKSLGINNKVLETRVTDAGLEDFKLVKNALKTFINGGKQ